MKTIIIVIALITFPFLVIAQEESIPFDFPLMINTKTKTIKEEKPKEDSRTTTTQKNNNGQGASENAYNNKVVKERSSASLGNVRPNSLICYNLCKSCDGKGDFQPDYIHPTISTVCPKCQGVDINVLYLRPCVKCNNTRKIKVYDPSYTKPEREGCQSCNGKGYSKNSRFEVASSDFAKQISYYEAVEAYKFINDNGWRLPTGKELKAMYYVLHKNGEGNFNGAYWAHDYWGTDATIFNFNTGISSSNMFHYPNNLRMVRDIQ